MTMVMMMMMTMMVMMMTMTVVAMTTTATTTTMMIMDHIYIYILKVHRHGISKIRKLSLIPARCSVRVAPHMYFFLLWTVSCAAVHHSKILEGP